MSKDRLFIILQLRKLSYLLCVNKIKKTLKHSDVVCPCIRVTLCPPNWPLMSVFSSSTFGSLSAVTKQTGCSILQFWCLFNNSVTIAISIYLENFVFSRYWSPLTHTTNKRTCSLVTDVRIYFCTLVAEFWILLLSYLNKISILRL